MATDINDVNATQAAFAAQLKSDHETTYKNADKLDKVNETLARVSEILSQLTKTQEETNERLLLLEQSRVAEETLQKMDNRLDGLASDVLELKLKPAKRWDTLQTLILSALVAGMIGYFIGIIC